MTPCSVVWSHCSSTMGERLQGMTEFTSTIGQSNGIELVEAIKSVSYNCIETTYKVDSINQALLQLVLCRQTSYMTTQQYNEQFKVQREVCEEVGGNPGESPGTLRLIAD
jgi:hypothetical protein